MADDNDGPADTAASPARAHQPSTSAEGFSQGSDDAVAWPSSSFGADSEDPAFLDALATLPLTPQQVVVHCRRSSQEQRGQASIQQQRQQQQQQQPDALEDAEFVQPAQLDTIRAVVEIPAVSTSRARASRVAFDLTPSPPKKKRPRTSEADDDGVGGHVNDAAARAAPAKTSDYLDNSTYDALRFGDFSTYMRNKRAKLKVQEHSLKEQEEALLAAAAATQQPSAGSPNGPSANDAAPQIFKGLTMYITGHTSPPYAELRRLIVLHGGNFMAYLDQKSPVTHIIASNLTPKKLIEFAAYRVARPEWITDSIQAQKRLAWQDYRVEADAGGAIGQGKLPMMAGPRSSSSSSAQAGSLSAQAGSFLTSASGQQADVRTAEVGKCRGFLAGATPWGRLAAQKKLSAFRAKPAGPPVDAGATAEVRSDPAQGGGKSPLPAEKLDIDVPTQRAASFAQVSPREVTPPPSRQYTKEEMEWLANLETPPKPGHDPDDGGMDWLANVETPPKPQGHVVGEATSTNVTPRPQEKAVAEIPTHAAKTFTPARPTEPPVTPSSKSFEAAMGTDPVSRKAATAAGHFAPHHLYAKRPSNVHAAKLLSTVSWREQNTATSESFLSGYFAKSRLHYLSIWKGELKDLVGQALKEAGREQGSQPLLKGMKRVIMHIDFDSFFVGVGLRSRPELKDKPVVVCHAGAAADTRTGIGTSSTSEIASCNYVAREFGIRNGQSLGRARQLCPHVQPIPYDFEGYKDVSIQFYSLLLVHADAIEAVSVDEALIDVSRLLHSMRVMRDGDDDDDDDARVLLHDAGEERQSLISAYRGHISSQCQSWTEEKQLAEALRDEIRRRTGCEASIGIGSNILQARLATRHAKPGGSFHLQPEAIEAFVEKLDVDDLQGVGYSTRQRFEKVFGTANIGALKAVASQSRFVAELGPNLGKQVWSKMHGIDRSELEGGRQRQSVGAAVNYAIRFANQDEAEKFVRNLATEVSQRLQKYKLRGKQCNVNIMVRDPEAPVEAPKFLGHGICDVHHRSSPMSGPAGIATNDAEQIFRGAWKLIRALDVDPRELRGIAINCTKLEPTDAPAAGSGLSTRALGGQTRLNFAPSPKKTPAKNATATTPTSTPSASRIRELRFSASGKLIHETEAEEREDYDDDYDDEEEGGEPMLQPGPTQAAERGRRELTPLLSADPPRKGAAQQTVHRVMTPARPSLRSQSVEPTPTPPAAPPLHRRVQAARGAIADAVAFPTMSQVDQAVLKELPPAIREEVLRETRRSSALSSSSKSTAMSRSVSASPSKSRGRTSREQQQQQQQRVLLPFVAAVARDKRQPPVDKAQPWAMDPSRVSAADLRAMDIDPAVFAVLPLEVQREVVQSQSRALRGREARFISGRHTGERTIAEERRIAVERAGGAGGEGGAETLVAQRVAGATSASASAPSISIIPPSIQKKSSTEEVKSLLQRWIATHGAQPPRLNDVNKFLTFLKDCARGTALPRRERGRGWADVHAEEAQNPHAADVHVPVGARCELSKVEELLLWWKWQVSHVVGPRPRARAQHSRKQRRRSRSGADLHPATASDAGAGAAAAASAGESSETRTAPDRDRDRDRDPALQGWWAAYDRVVREVNDVVRGRYGGTLRV